VSDDRVEVWERVRCPHCTRPVLTSNEGRTLRAHSRSRKPRRRCDGSDMSVAEALGRSK
jgi:hypothetical protein